MQLSAPRQWTFYLALALWVLALLARWVPALQTEFGSWPAGYVLALLAGLVLIIGNTMKNM